MSFGDEELTIGKWLTDTLQGDTALMNALPAATRRVYDGPAPDATDYPILEILNQSPGMTVRGVGNIEVMLNSLWVVRGVWRGSSYAPLQVIAERIQAVLAGVTAQTVSGGTIEGCVREQAFRQGMVVGGRDFRYLGGVYRIYVQGS